MNDPGKAVSGHVRWAAPGSGSSITAHGRWLGLVLLAAVALLMVAVPPVDGRRIAGNPRPAGLPAAPQPGDCLLAPATVPARPAPADAPTAPWSGSTSPMFARFGPCDRGSPLSEVVAVHSRSGGEPGSPPDADCRDAVAGYAGLRRTPAGYVPLADANPSTAPGTDGVGPDPVVESVEWTYPFRAAQRWVAQAPSLPGPASTWFACIAGPPTTPQQGALKDAFAGGRLPPGYGRCWVATDPRPGDATVACAWPHISELLGVAVVADPATIDTSQLQQSCLRLSGRLLGRADPTVGGQLSIRAERGDPLGATGPGTTGSTTATAGAAFCYASVTGGRLAQGSVVGLRSAAITYLE